jgi:nucleotide-binding universal stress UspA family protein
MTSAQVGAPLTLKTILFLTDFSQPSEAALPFAVALAREYEATVHALHILLPEAYVFATTEATGIAIEAQEENAQAEMQRVESRLSGVAHEVSVMRGVGIWQALEKVIESTEADLIVLGTHGRTGAQKMLLGSVAEEIFRRSHVPVLTIGPLVKGGVHNAAHFRRILLATDFSDEARSAAPYAISLAQENQARLFLLHVIHERKQERERTESEISVANAMHELHELMPSDAEMWCRPEPMVQYGDPATRILETTEDREVDLIVLGVREAAGRLSAATHLERSVAHKIVAHAKCPVLTVRG